ncbi:hypothetical protein K8Z61_10335 [Nocardioides sp. TRM66260-LWL]|uniref:acyltransferase n=1 Tax=Nocardioides sp. TRM66260-LWL TaxID=2874478 RepID=UPI001CC82861|nr:hypothetical protein [Nocardioides sp. TRM66260-LWL]MBZ5734893.1 hypothetical protein [Nocardioides sp. TRM66260-LWL]
MIWRVLAAVGPWWWRRLLLTRLLGYEIHPTARIGLAWFYPRHLVMGPGARVGHLNVAVHLDEVRLGENATIGRSNWVTGFPSGTDSAHFRHQPERRSTLVVGAESAITKGHHLDCTSPIEIGSFVTVAGYRSELLTHSIDIEAGRQHSAPIRIGDRSFVGTGCLLLGGATLPERSVLAARSVLTEAFDEPLGLYGGQPARRLKDIPPDAGYLTRTRGFVD